MKKIPLVSIIIPIYNTEKYLKKCLDSVTGQTYKNIEIILVDDDSTDDSKKIINEFARKDRRIKVIRQKNQGQSAARNNGLKKATGNYVCFADSDDYLAKTFVEKLLKLYEKDENSVLSVCGIYFNWLKTRSRTEAYLNPIRKRKKNESKKAYILYLLAVDGRLYSSVNKLFKREYLKDAKFDEKLNFAEDTKFVLDYLKNVPEESTISFYLEPLYYYNYGTETSTIVKTSTLWKNWQNSYKNLKKWVGKKPSARERFWLLAIYARWRISHHRAKKRFKHN